MSYSDYTTAPIKIPTQGELFFATSYSGPWHLIPLDPAKCPKVGFLSILQKQQNSEQWSSSTLEKLIFYTTGTVFPPPMKRIWLKYVLDHIIVRIGGKTGCLCGSNPVKNEIRADFKEKKVSLKGSMQYHKQSRYMRTVGNSCTGYYMI